MPAGSSAPGRRQTWRPLGVRLAGVFFTVLLFLVCTAVWLAFDPEVRDAFSVTEKGMMLALGVGVVVIVYALGRSRLTVDGDRVTVVNGYKRRELERAEVVALSLPRGAPWAVLDLGNGTTIPVMGIQSSDGPRAQVAVRDARAALTASL